MTRRPPSKTERRRRARAARARSTTRCGPSSPTPRAPEVDAESFHVDDREPEGDEKDDHRERRAVAELQVLQQGVEGVQRDWFRGCAGAAARHDVDEVKDAEGIERPEDEG